MDHGLAVRLEQPLPAGAGRKPAVPVLAQAQVLLAAMSAAAQRDADLVSAWRRVDYASVLHGLMQRYRQKVLHLTVSIVRDPALAEDMAQLAFMKAWRALPKFDGRAALSTWLYAIARNTCLSELRSRGRLVSLDDEASESIVWEDERDTVIEAQAELDVATLLESLSEPSRTVVVLFYLEDRSCEEVGTLLDMPVGTVKSLLFRARQALAAAARSEEASHGK